MEIDVNDSELINKICYSVIFCYHLYITAPETVKLTKEADKDKHFGESTIFRCHSDFKMEICLQIWFLRQANQKML